MKTIVAYLITGILCSGLLAQSIPLPEHPNPIKLRDDWQNLNGKWDFAFDAENVGIKEKWASGEKDFDQKIEVPFPWGSALSQVKDDADIGWYKREVNVLSEWNQKRTFLIIGASDWETHVWLDGVLLGNHQGGYVPFEFELTEHLKYGEKQTLVIRADDARRAFTLYGKQGYGNARGIWQTVYLEARGADYIAELQVSPDIDSQRIDVKAFLPEIASEDKTVSISIKGAPFQISSKINFKKGQREARTRIDIPNQRLWTLDDPYLYDIEATLEDDILKSYFGMRKISVMNLPGTDYPYIALNNEPIYVQLALDQSYHPEGYYTFPSDQFMIDEINRSKSIGLNGIRTHIKVEIPRKLYWADKLGLLVMEDLPNSWGEPEEKMRRESTYTLEEMIKRDYNHPSIFSWILINETWGMRTTTEKGREYLPETQRWLVSLYYLAKSLDPTRIIEDNSICCGAGHTVTDLNSWHHYLPGYKWEERLSEMNEKTFPGSSYHYEKGYLQGGEPNINSECGNVWGYDGSAGDVDWTWDYHRMINTFRKYPKIGGWLYTEHHDVINEWNGYWRFDRSEKKTGLGEIVPGMTLNDLHSDIYISTGQEICYTVGSGQEVEIPLFISVMTGRSFDSDLKLEYELSTIDEFGESKEKVSRGSMLIPYKAWMQKKLEPLKITAQDYNGLGTLQLILKSKSGEVLHRNFVHLVVNDADNSSKTKAYNVAAKDYSDSNWSKKTWDAMEGKKVNGAGKGYFEYTIKIPPGEKVGRARHAYFIVEASAKELFVKDQEEYNRDQDFMKGSKVANSSNPNSYPMTDEILFPSTISVSINEKQMRQVILPDDPADHRGVLSWHAQPQDRKLREAGSYGYPIKISLNRAMLKEIEEAGEMMVRLEALGEGGLAIYGKDFGRYPFDPSLVVKY